MDFEALKAPLNKDAVKTRRQAGMTLSYIESWHAIAEANRIFGHDGWNSETVMLERVREEQVDGKWRIGYVAKARVTVFNYDCQHVERAVREGIGYGSGIARDLGDAIESAVKEAESDSRKRALMTFGNPFGLALYDKEQRNVTSGNSTPPEPTREEPQEMTGEPAPLPPEPGSFWKQESYFLPVPKNKAGDLDFKAWADKDYKPVLRKALKERSLDELNKLIRDNEETVKQIWNDGIKGLWADIADCERMAREYVVNRANGRKAA